MKKYYKNKRLMNKLENINHKEEEYRILQNRLSDDFYEVKNKIASGDLDKSIIGKFFTFDVRKDDNVLRVHLVIGIENTTISMVTFLFHFIKNKGFQLGVTNPTYSLDIIDFLSEHGGRGYRESTKEEIELVLKSYKSRKIKKILKEYYEK